MDTPLQQPAGKIGGELAGAFFQAVEGRRRLRRVGREEPVEDGVGVVAPLLKQPLAVGCRQSGHQNSLWRNKENREVSYVS